MIFLYVYMTSSHEGAFYKDWVKMASINYHTSSLNPLFFVNYWQLTLDTECKWIYKIKKNTYGYVFRCKARLVAKRRLLALAPEFGWKLRKVHDLNIRRTTFIWLNLKGALILFILILCENLRNLYMVLKSSKSLEWDVYKIIA